MTYNGLLAGQEIRNMRNKKKWSIEQLSEAVGKSPSHIIQVELGSRKMSLDLLYSFMTIFGEDANSILQVEIEHDENQFSVDRELEKLDEQQRNYLINVFKEMITNIPA